MAYTTQQLAERFIDQREIQNVMGKYALLTMICKQADLVDKFWSKQAETPTLARNDGWYVGLEAISGYYQAISDNLAAKLPLMRKLFPKELGDKSDEEIFGVGEHFPRPITTPSRRYISTASIIPMALARALPMGKYIRQGITA